MPGYSAIYNQGCLAGAEESGHRTRPLSPSDRELFEELQLLGFLDDGVLNTLGVAAWGCSGRQPPLPHILSCRGELSKIPCPGGKAPPETQGHGCPARLY